MGKSKRDFYLVHPENADFVTGKTSAPAKRGKTGRGFITWLITAVMSVGLLGLLVFTGISWNNYIVLSTQGEVTDGVIETKRWTEGEASTFHFFGYSFEVEGQTYTGETRVPEVRYNTTDEGTAVSILYFPNNPNQSVLADHHLRPYPITVVTVVFGLLGLVLLLSLAQLRRKSDTLSQKGQVVRGEITYVRRVENDGEPFFNIEYQFEEPGTANTLKGKSKSKAKLFGRNRPEQGMTVAVYYADRKTHELL